MIRLKTPFILILDENPRKCARALTISHIKYYIPICHEIFVAYHTGENLNKPHVNMWVYYMRRNRSNYLWVVKFYKELQELFKNKISTKNKYFYDQYNKFDEKYLEVDTTLPIKRVEICVPAHCADKHLGNNKKYKEFKKNVVVKNRIKFLIHNFPNDAFIDYKPPEWYSRVKQTFEFKNEIDNMVVRITRTHAGNFRYYCKPGLSDVWLEVKKVPYDMRFIVNALLYKNIDIRG